MSAIALYNVLVIVIITCNLFNTFIHVHVNSSTIHVQFQYPQQTYVNMIYIISNQNVLYYMKYGGKTFPSPLQFLKNKPLQSRWSKTSIMFPKKKIITRFVWTNDFLVYQYEYLRYLIVILFHPFHTFPEYLEGMHPTTLKTKKHVRFQPGKENNPASHEGEQAAVPSADSKITNLKERLYQAKLRGLALRKAEMTSKLKSKQLLSLR